MLFHPDLKEARFMSLFTLSWGGKKKKAKANSYTSQTFYSHLVAVCCMAAFPNERPQNLGWKGLVFISSYALMRTRLIRKGAWWFTVAKVCFSVLLQHVNQQRVIWTAPPQNKRLKKLLSPPGTENSKFCRLLSLANDTIKFCTSKCKTFLIVTIISQADFSVNKSTTFHLLPFSIKKNV